jgi:hypothetical protein
MVSLKMVSDFRRTPRIWPNDARGYVFLARGFNEIGRASFSDKWPKEEVSSMADPKKENSSVVKRALKMKAGSHGFTADELRELDKDDEVALADEAEDARHGMWVVVKNEIVKQCLEGNIVSAVRPIEGGEFIGLLPDMWNTEKNLEHRFRRWQMSLDDPFSTSGDTHWIFLQREALDSYLIGKRRTTATQTLIHMSPYLRFMLQVSESMKLTPDHQPKKTDVMDTIRKTWRGKPLSEADVQSMATLIREPDSRRGSAKGKKNRSE